MTLKRIAVLVLMLIVIVAAACLAYQYYNTSKQMYEGVLVERPFETESTYECA